METEVLTICQDSAFSERHCDSCWGLKSILDREYADILQFRYAVVDLCRKCQEVREKEPALATR